MIAAQKNSFLDFVKDYFESRDVKLSKAALEEWWNQFFSQDLQHHSLKEVIWAIRDAGRDSKYKMVQTGDVIQKLVRKPQISSNSVDEKEIKKKIEKVKNSLVSLLPNSLWSDDVRVQYDADKAFLGGTLATIEIMMRNQKPDIAKKVYETMKRVIKKIDWEEWPIDPHIVIHNLYKDEIKNEPFHGELGEKR